MKFNNPFRKKTASTVLPVTTQKRNHLSVIEGQIEYYKAEHSVYINKAFRNNVDVYKIVSDCATRRAENPIELVKVKDKKALKMFFAKGKQPIADLFGLKALQVKALGDVVDKSDIITLLNKPNPYQNGNEFEQMASIWYDLLGEVVIWAQKISPESTSPPVALHVIPPFDIACISNGEMKGTKEYKIVSINQTIPKEEILFLCRPNPKSTEIYTPNRGFSPLEAGKMVVQRSNEADQAAVDLMQTKGAVGAVYLDDSNTYLGEKEEEEEEAPLKQHENNFIKKMYGKFAKHRVFFSNAKLGYVQFGRTSDEIGVIEHDKVATSKLCRLFNYPEILLTGDIKYENLRAASKQLIVSNIMPYQTMIAEALTSFLIPKFIKQNPGDFALVYDPLYYSEIQEDIKDIGEVLENVTYLTINEKRAFLSYEPLTDPLADQLLVKQGLVLLEDLTLNNQVLPNVDYPSGTTTNDTQTAN